MPDLAKAILKMAAELIKYQAKKQLGEGFINTFAESLTDYLGENTTERINAFIETGNNGEKLLAAFQDADLAFSGYNDKTLRQMIISKPLRQLETLEKLASALPKTLDDDGLFETLHHQFASDWPNLTNEIHTRAASLYRICLERALAIHCNQLLPSIFSKVERIEAKTDKILSALYAAPEKQTASQLDKTMSRLQRFRLYNVPKLPENFLPRQDDLQLILGLLNGDDGGRVAITGRSLRVGVQGMGGVGKSVLAAAIARSYEVEQRFPDGVFWITFGQTPDLIKLQGMLGKAIGDPTIPYGSIQEGTANLDEALKEKTCLLILDDVWQEDHAEAFDLPNHQGCILLTGRNRQVMQTFRAQMYYLDVLDDARSLNLLTNWAGYDAKNISVQAKSVAKEIVKECGYLPLALAMAGALVKEQDWEYVLYCLKNADLAELSRRFPYDHPNLLRAIQVSIDNLQQVDKELYQEFAVFPEDTPIPIATLEILWAKANIDKQANKIGTKRAVDLFASRSLLQKDQNGNVTLHDLQMDYIRKDANLDFYHRKLVNAYRKYCGTSWHTGPNDGYFLQHIAWHLIKAGFERELYLLLLDYRWLKRKLSAGEINSLIVEYDLIKRDDENIFWPIQFVLSLARHILSKDMYQLPSQLIGRLATFEHKSIIALLNTAAAEDDWPWLQPLTPSLTRPGTGEVMTLEGHSLGVRSVVVLSNGKQAISASEDKTLRIWGLDNGRCLRTLDIGDQHNIKRQGNIEERGGYINALLLTQDQNHIILAMHDKTIKIWDLETGACTRIFEGHTERVYSLALMAEEKRLISGSGDNTVKIWDMDTGNCILTLLEHTDPVRALAVSENDNRLFSGAEDGSIRVWHPNSGRCIKTLIDAGSVRSISLASKSNDLIFSGKEGLISVWDWKNAVGNWTTDGIKRQFDGHHGLVSCVITLNHKNNQFIASASRDRTIKIWHPNGKMAYSFEGHSKGVNCIAPIPSNLANQPENTSRIISASEDGTLKIWDLDLAYQQLISKSKETEQHRGPIKMLALAAGGKKLVSASQDGIVKCWSMEDNKYFADLAKHKKAINSLAVSSDGNSIISAGGERVISWNIEQNEKTEYVRAGKIRALALVPYQRKVILAPYDNAALEILDLDNHESRALRGHTGPVYLLEVTSDGNHLVSAARGKDNSIKIWDLRAHECIHTLEAHRRFVISMALTPNGRQIATGLWNGKIKIWDIEHGKCLQTLEGHTESVHSLAITPDGKAVVSGSWDKTIRIWSIETGKCLQILAGHSEIVNAVSISPNGKHVMSVANDNKLKVWDAYSGKCLFTYWADAPMYTTIVDPLSDTIIAGDQKGRIHFLKPMWQKK